MFGSFDLGTVFGIKVRMHRMFVWMVLGVTLFSNDPPGATLAWISTAFGIVFLHELGHCFMARHFGIRVIDITFWPLGGMARMTEIPEDSKTEGLIALAGPAVNFALALLVAPVFLWSRMAVGESSSLLLHITAQASFMFLWINLALGTFNLLPAFPMDGGRVLRAFLGRKGDWLRATERAVAVGKFFAVLMFLATILLDGGVILALIGVFVWYAGSRELLGVRMRHARQAAGPMGAGGAGGTGGIGFQGLGGLADLFAAAQQAQARASAARDATFDDHPDADTGPHTGPPIGLDSATGHSGQGGVTDEDIERLESYRGRMRRPDRDG